MKTFDLVIDVKDLKLGDTLKDLKIPELTAEITKRIILSADQRGLTEEDRRKYYKICDAFDAAIKEGKTSVELEDDWVGLIRRCKRETKLLPDNLLRKVEDAIDAIKDR